MEIDSVLTTALAKVPDLDPAMDSKVQVVLNDGGIIRAMDSRLDDAWELLDDSGRFLRQRITTSPQLERALDEYVDFTERAVNTPQTANTDVVDTLDVINPADLPDPNDIINGRAGTLGHQDPASCYAIGNAIVHKLQRRVKDLMIPDTFDAAIAVWEKEVDHTAAFMSENFAFMPELSILVVNQMREQNNLDILAIDKPNVQKLRAELQPLLG
jgi:hypothetical protein